MWFRFVRDKWHEGPAKLTVLILARLWFCLASTPPATRAVIYSAAKTAPAPARRTPGAGGTKYNSVLGQRGLLHCHAPCDAAPRPPEAARQGARQFAGILHAICPALRSLFSQARQEGKPQPQRAQKISPSPPLPKASVFTLLYGRADSRVFNKYYEQTRLATG